ncbi:HlyD family efflux transporter periplasmic adaptor subunit [Pseudomonas typographi]|uniref:HlyD family efflux transporter periplasmic adaptor subunit n=1 Tax=Pseudomonas typographi TaxID=2715964 RepID=A0ABR7Z293_9PSED|nr:HlyD family efflux transporter periplasmic adaptor subunit [Pseudomonas typographi]MBD1552358.1 HlyD family efflux transporter periplasmic adaptor subunit [Pseudomonas typographi]MBD1587247.1 HlyD family efflux transporter periplasmic adaptor subunit [Pseudomonas typographi]MBD1599562.1 HlyD family efflux transporter periplasmic adaptor subunit [Pseudomonas typographi]
MATAENTAGGKPDDAQIQPKGNTRKRKLLLLILLVLIVLAAIGVWVWHEMYGRWYESTDDAYVNGNVVSITPLTGGTVTSIQADDGDLVQAGQTLITLDPADARIALQSAQANLARTVRQVRGYYTNVDAQRAQVASRKADVQRAQDNYNRRKNLAAGGAISQEELSHARDDLTNAQSALNNAEQQLATTLALVDDTEIASHPDVQAAAAQVRDAYLAQARTTIVAPVTGYVAKRTAQLGQRLQPGANTMAVIPLDQLWLDANFKETQLRDMRIGQPVTITADLYGGDVEYRGSVESLGAGTGSAFSLLPAQNATGNWIKIVQRVPVRIKLDGEQLKQHPLRIGLSTLAEVDLHDQSGAMLAQQPPQQASFTTDVYDKQLLDADDMIARLIRDNSAGGKAAQR